MITYQGLEKARASGNLENFIKDAIDEYQTGKGYVYMIDAEKYANGENAALMSMQSEVMLDGGYTADVFARIRVPTGIFDRIVTQLVNRLWFNAVQLDDQKKKNALGRGFDVTAKNMATNAAIHGVCYGFWNLDRLQMFTAKEYFPFPDDRTGAHMAGTRFWRLDEDSPWVVQLYEMDGWTEYSMGSFGGLEIATHKTAYKTNVRRDALGEEIVGGENYPGFPCQERAFHRCLPGSGCPYPQSFRDKPVPTFLRVFPKGHSDGHSR